MNTCIEYEIIFTARVIESRIRKGHEIPIISFFYLYGILMSSLTAAAVLLIHFEILSRFSHILRLSLTSLPPIPVQPAPSSSLYATTLNAIL